MTVQVEWLDDHTVRLSTPRADGLLVIQDVGWESPGLARANFETALRMFADKHVDDTVERLAGQKEKIRKLGPLWFNTLSGPPTWWCPRLSFRRWAVMVGWLQRGYVLSLRGR